MVRRKETILAEPAVAALVALCGTGSVAKRDLQLLRDDRMMGLVGDSPEDESFL